MKRAPRTDEDDGGGLDSLLDTMTNVVGILVMVLIATQLGVKDAVSRISESEVVDASALEAARQELLLTKSQRDAIESQLNDLQPADHQEIEVKLADLRRQVQERRTELDREQVVANQFALKIESDTKKAEQARKQIQEIADAKAKRESLQAELTKAIDQEASLKALLDETPEQEVPPAKVVTLPDPRPAPEGARQVTFLCTNNRVYPVAADDWRDGIRQKAEFLVKAKRLDRGPAVGVDKEQFIKEFKKANRRLSDEFFEVELYDAGIYPRLKFTPKPNSGATQDEVLKPRSRFQRLLARLDKTKYYARFIVLPDSFEVYLAARAVADEAGLLSGWDPQGSGWEYTTYLGGPILFGPKPKPDPNAKPAPPSKPANVID